jgi:hypothetical protein
MGALVQAFIYRFVIKTAFHQGESVLKEVTDTSS